MALADAVLAIVEEMERAAKEDVDEPTAAAVLKMYSRQFRIALKAAEGAAPPQASPAAAMTMNPFLMGMMGPAAAAAQNFQGVEAAKAEFRGKKNKLAEMGLGPDGSSTVYLVGGPHDGDSVACPAEVEVGKLTNMGTEKSPIWYRMGADFRAYFDEEKTVKGGGKVPEKQGTILLP